MHGSLTAVTVPGPRQAQGLAPLDRLPVLLYSLDVPCNPNRTSPSISENWYLNRLYVTYLISTLDQWDHGLKTITSNKSEYINGGEGYFHVISYTDDVTRIIVAMNRAFDCYT